MRVTVDASAIVAIGILVAAPFTETPWLLVCAGLIGVALSVRWGKVKP